MTENAHSTSEHRVSLLYVGTSGWAYPIWKPGFYPKDVSAKNFLKSYATRLNAVEVNYTFRRLLSEQAAQSWMADVGRGFKFVVKANYYITHVRRLKNVVESLERFLPTLEPLRKRKQLGPVLFQLPPNFKADVPLLRDFLAQLPRGMKYAVEFRHESWFSDATYRALTRRNVALCVAETESITTPEERTAKFIYFRFRRPSYKPAERRTLADRVERCVADGLETYAFFKHEEDPRSPLNAVELLKAVRKKLAG
jgi:uncharacterized protein YecE (DUF72 family)